jgi:hypothetical protein
MTQNSAYTFRSLFIRADYKRISTKAYVVLKVYENMDLYLHSSSLELQFLKKRDASTDNL